MTRLRISAKSLALVIIFETSILKPKTKNLLAIVFRFQRRKRLVGMPFRVKPNRNYTRRLSGCRPAAFSATGAVPGRSRACLQNCMFLNLKIDIYLSNN